MLEKGHYIYLYYRRKLNNNVDGRFIISDIILGGFYVSRGRFGKAG